MPGTALAVQTPTSGGVAPVYNAAALQNSIPANNGRTIVHIKNGSGASINATIKTNLAVDGTPAADKVIAVPAGAERIIGPFPPGIYNFSDGSIEIDISVITTVTIAVYQIP